MNKYNTGGSLFSISLIFLLFGWLPFTSYTQNCNFDDPQKQLEYDELQFSSENNQISVSGLTS